MAGLRKGGFLISKIHQTAGRVFARKLRQRGVSDINPAQGRILFCLWQEDRIPVSRLAIRTGLDKSTLTRMLDRLVESGHLARVAPEDDRRTTLVCLTGKHLGLRQLYDEVSGEMIELFYRGFSDQEISEFEQCLERILDNLAVHEDSIKRH
jgi:DNA-binding MarR family transcriptional regulator